MSEFDISILKQNVRILIKKAGITQEELGKQIGMSQPNICKALNDNDKKCFTVSQIYSIAEYFHVSVDWLIGFKSVSSDYSPKSVAELIAKLLADKVASFREITLKEKVYRPFWGYDEDGYGHPDCKICKEDFTYRAIYFPNYYDPSEIAKDPEEYCEYDGIASQEGNETHYSYVNEFLTKYLQILPIYHAGKLSDDVFHNIVDEFLTTVPDN